MTVKEYIKNIIQELVNDYKNIEVSYQYDDLSDTHIIKVVPTEIYYNNESYKDIELSIYEDFFKKYPDKSLVFITSDSLIDVDNPEFVASNRDIIESVVNHKTWNSNDLDIHLSQDYINLILLQEEIPNESLLNENFIAIINDLDTFTNNIFTGSIEGAIVPQPNEDMNILADETKKMALAA